MLRQVKKWKLIAASISIGLTTLLLGLWLSFRVDPNATDDEKRAQIEDFYNISSVQFSGISEISAHELKEKVYQYVLVDVRTAEEQSVSMLPGAITQEEFEKNKEAFRGKPVVTYCTIGYRSGLFAKQLGNDWDVANLRGSILSWCHAGGRLVSGDDSQSPEETKRVHIYSKQWNLLPKGYEAVW